MKIYDKLDDSSFLLYAAKHYNNPQCYDTLEFYEDLKKFKYIKRLLNKFKSDGELRERLILNHIISLNNVFGPEHSTRMLFLKLKGYEEYIIPFLILLNTLPPIIYNMGSEGINIQTDEFNLNTEVINKLRNI